MGGGKNKIAIIDYKMSNIYSINNALNVLGYSCEIVNDYKALESADGAILPGVGSFPEAMKHLTDLDLVDPIRDFVMTGKPFLGICLGLQLLFSESKEFGETAGLGIFDGKIEQFKISEVKRIPHVGWNTITPKKNDGIRCDIDRGLDSSDSAFFYFVHSFYVKPTDPKIVCTTTKYEGFEFCSSVSKDNIFACQFHPEKSGKKGLKVLSHFFGRT